MNDRKTTVALWGVYISLLAVLLPHTAWAFGQFEPQTTLGNSIAWCAAVAFEFAIAVLTHKLAKHIESVPNSKKPWLRFRRRYVNAYSVGLLTAISVSTLANLAHAVEFGQSMSIFARYGIPFSIFACAFGAVLPLVSLLFARVLSNVTESEHAADPEVIRAKEENRRLRTEIKKSKEQLAAIEGGLAVAEQQAHVLSRITGENKQDRIIAAAGFDFWSDLPRSTIAAMTKTAPSYVTEVLKREERDNGNNSRKPGSEAG